MYDPAKLVEAKIPADRLDAMNREARRIRSYLRWRGMDAVYLPEATIDEFWEMLDDVPGLRHGSHWARPAENGTYRAVDEGIQL